MKEKLEEKLQKYLTRLNNLKENRARTVDTNTDVENEVYDGLIKVNAEMCRDLKEILELI